MINEKREDILFPVTTNSHHELDYNFFNDVSAVLTKNMNVRTKIRMDALKNSHRNLIKDRRNALDEVFSLNPKTRLDPEFPITLSVKETNSIQLNEEEDFAFNAIKRRDFIDCSYTHYTTPRILRNTKTRAPIAKNPKTQRSHESPELS